MIGIYKITSPSGRIYIGQSRNIEKRFKQYKWSDPSTQIKLRKSFLKYGYINHVFEIQEECAISELNKREHYWGHFYNCIESGLNLQLPNPEKIVDEVSKKFSAEHKINLSLAQTGEKNHRFGKTGKQSHKSKSVICTETGMTFESITACSDYSGWDRSHLNEMLNGKLKNNSTYKLIEK